MTLEDKVKDEAVLSFVSAAAMDGFLTNHNIETYGTSFEGNLLLQHFMQNSDPTNVLFTAKLLSCGIVLGAASYLARNGHVKKANAVLYSGAVIWGAAALANLYYVIQP